MDNSLFLWLLCHAFMPTLSGTLFLIAWLVCRHIARRPVVDRMRWLCLLATLVVSLPVIGICNKIFVDEALWQAANDGKVAQVKRLLDAGAFPSKGAEGAEGTPLMIAAFRGHKEVVQLLIEHGAEVNQKAAFLLNDKFYSDSYQSPLEVAQDQPEIVAILKQAGAH